MANFTDTELEAAVSRYVKGETTTQRTELGPLSTDHSFSEARELVASTLVFDPSSVFYLLSLAANRVNQDVLLGLEYVDDIRTAIDEVGADTTVVTQTSLLEDAASALIDAERSISASSVITTRPFERYTRALDSFIEKSLTPNIRRLTGSGFPSTYEIVRPPQKAQSDMKTTVSSLSELHTTILSEAAQLLVALSEFLAANLPLESVQNSVPLVRKDLRTLKDAFDSATADGAIELTKDAYLSVQAGRSVVTNLLTISDPRDPRMQSGDTDRAQAAVSSNESSPAETFTEVSAPYLVTPTTNEVKIGVDGGSEQTIALTVPSRGEVESQSGGPYEFYPASRASLSSSIVGPYTVPASPDNVFSIYVDGIGYQTYMAPGSQSASYVVNVINNSVRIDGEPGTFQDVGTAFVYGGRVYLNHDTIGDGSLVLGDASALNTALGFGNEEESAGQEANNELRFFLDFQYEAVVPMATGSFTAAQVASQISGSSPYLEAEVSSLETDSGPIDVVLVRSASYGEGSHVLVSPLTPTQEAGFTALGMFDGQSGQGEYLSLNALESELEALSGVSLEQELVTVQAGTGGQAVYDGGFLLRLPLGTLSTSIVATDNLRISSGENTGNYPISSVSFGPFYDEIFVGRPFPVVVGDASQNLEWEVRNDSLYIRSETSSIASKLEVGAGSAHSELGLTSGTYLGEVSGVRIKDGSSELNFSRNDVVVGDLLTLSGPTYSSQHTITDVSSDGYQVEVYPLVSSDLTGHEYQVDSSGGLAYETFLEQLTAWDEGLSDSKFSEDIQELERVLNPLLFSRNPAAAVVGTARSTANALRAVYSELSTVLADFVTLRVPRVDALLDMLKERGLDRAHDLLLLGEFTEFFSATKDGSSYGGNLLEKMRSIAQNDVPQGRALSDDNVDDRLDGSYEEADADFDFSDQDDESGELEIDDVPDSDDDEESLFSAV